MFDGSIEHVNCVTQHEDYGHLIHKAVLLQVGPLLKDKNGRGVDIGVHVRVNQSVNISFY